MSDCSFLVSCRLARVVGLGLAVLALASGSSAGCSSDRSGSALGPAVVEIDRLTYCSGCEAGCQDGYVCADTITGPGCAPLCDPATEVCGLELVCSPIGGGRHACLGSGGGCPRSFLSGRADCNNDPLDGFEADLGSVDDCARCGHSCVGGLNHAAATCAAGVCTVSTCADGWRDCDGIPGNGCETPLGTDAHCGRCFEACAQAVPNATASCVEGECRATGCREAWIDCDHDGLGVCEARLGTEASCGGCGDDCSDHEGHWFCDGRECKRSPCHMPGMADCDGDGVCDTELGTDANCGGCGAGCARVLSNATGFCAAGACRVATCDAGWADCNGAPEDGCEANLAIDRGNCGACGAACAMPANGAAACAVGACTLVACSPGTADCNGDPSDGCEGRLDEASSCGGCGVSCGAHQVCEGGFCGCEVGYSDCDGIGANGCETHVATDPAACGGCGRDCGLLVAGAAAVCVDGACAAGACDDGYADCDDDPSNGCETATGANPAHCGGCGVDCAAAGFQALCEDGECVPNACPGGTADCDDNGSCETDLSHPATCGSCGNDCGALVPNATAGCLDGVCGVAACAQGRQDCDGQPATGCELALDDDAHCGDCETDCTQRYPNGVGRCTAGLMCELVVCELGFDDCDPVAPGCEADLSSEATCGDCDTACAFGETCAQGVCE